ncbi:beta-amyrin 11-oxidase-like [Juglans microcarpa x Juglans regia]|uniref:beta-amyrin 11-oxidase-like n=1 Tax=Juglans microcarpa x Juglans regia TaxID=2249226 RepID=UPI001B7E57A3|nr:beta-amyrin 11-oxidase-like [Juglans microcarpa x Juglans regia]
MEFMMIICSILAVLLGVYVFVFQFLKGFNEWYYVDRLGKTQYPLPPGDMGLPFLGSLPAFLKAFRSGDPESFVHNLFSKYGKIGIYKTYLFGSPCVIVCSPETCRRVLTDDARFKLGYPKATTILAGRTSFHNLSGSEHKRLRRLTTAPMNGHEVLSGHIDMIEGIVATAMEEWASTNKPVELLTVFRRVGFEIITKIFISSYSEAVISSIKNSYSDLSTGMKSQVINLPGSAFRRGLKARKELIKIFQSILEQKKEIIANNSNQTEAKKDLMDLLLGVRDEEGRGLEEEDIIDILIVLMLAGHESSAHGATWAVIYLSQHPEVLRKAKEEQVEIVKRRPSTQKGLSLDEIRQMNYLSMVINEMLRRASLSVSLFREAKEDVNLNGYLIPKGWKVLVWNRSVHMDPELYENPKQFDPSRWDNNYKPKAGTFLPFGAGGRVCPGSDLARIEISVFLHCYLLNYRVELLNPECPVTHLPIARPADLGLARVIKVT